MGTDILGKIIETKREEIRRAKRAVPVDRLRQAVIPGVKRRPFFESLRTPGPSGVNIIAEIKRASPSKGPICLDLDAALQARRYETGGAAALSVLTDTPYFSGRHEDLIEARTATRLPVLRKEFIISAYQIYESVALGADAMLLIARILERTQLRDYLALCAELGLDALVEIHSETDLESASWAGARLIGINNRNLTSFATDIETAPRLVSLLDPGQIPIAASGIGSREDVERNLGAGIYNLLIGESLVRAEDPARFISTLCGKEIKPPNE